MRQIMKFCTLAAALALYVFGAYTLRDEIHRFLPQQRTEFETAAPMDENKAENDAGDAEKPRFQHPQLVLDGELTEGTNDLVFVHENGFEVGKERYKDATAEPDVQMDDKRRLHRFSVRIDPENVAMYSVGPEKDPVEPCIFAEGAPDVMLTNHTWRYAVHPYLNALTKFAHEAKSPVVMVVECRYNTANENVPHYVDLKAFTPDDMGGSCSVWVTFYNTDPKRQLDYSTGRWLSTSAPEPSGEGGGANG